MKKIYHFKWLPPKAKNKWFDSIDRHARRESGRSVSGSKILAAFDEEGNIAAYSCVKCMRGNWYLGSCYVFGRHRGQGLQRELIKERLFYLKLKTNVVRVGVAADNKISRKNIIATGFTLERKKYEYDVYVKRW